MADRLRGPQRTPDETLEAQVRNIDAYKKRVTADATRKKRLEEARYESARDRRIADQSLADARAKSANELRLGREASKARTFQGIQVLKERMKPSGKLLAASTISNAGIQKAGVATTKVARATPGIARGIKKTGSQLLNTLMPPARPRPRRPAASYREESPYERPARTAPRPSARRSKGDATYIDDIDIGM
jgi:hypothetical protein